MKLKELTGKVFGRLTVIEFSHKAPRGHSVWKCRCECGKEKLVFSTNLTSGCTQSCGCLSREIVAARSSTHGESYSKEYKSWQSMIGRCRNPKDPNFKYYGGRGITVFQEWERFENFLAYMGRRPTSGHSIDRYPDKNGNYEPGNCRWATATEQNNNTRSNHLLTFKGRTQSIAQWKRELGLGNGVIERRLKLCWTIERTLCKTPKKRSSGK